MPEGPLSPLPKPVMTGVESHAVLPTGDASDFATDYGTDAQLSPSEASRRRAVTSSSLAPIDKGFVGQRKSSPQLMLPPEVAESPGGGASGEKQDRGFGGAEKGFEVQPLVVESLNDLARAEGLRKRRGQKKLASSSGDVAALGVAAAAGSSPPSSRGGGGAADLSSPSPGGASTSIGGSGQSSKGPSPQVDIKV